MRNSLVLAISVEFIYEVNFKFFHWYLSLRRLNAISTLVDRTNHVKATKARSRMPRHDQATVTTTADFSGMLRSTEQVERSKALFIGGIWASVQMLR